MELRQLKVFIAVAEGKSITSVADAFSLTKGAVSYILNNIEREVGVELFIRNPRKMSLSESGTMFLRTAKDIVLSYDKGIETIQSVNKDISGDLRIGLVSFVEPYVRKAVALLLKQYPSLSVSAYVYRSSTLNQLLKAGKLDIAFTINKAYEDEGIISEPCIPLQIVAIMSKTHTLASKSVVTFDDLCRHECIMPSEDKRAFATINQYLDKDLNKLKRRVSVNTTDGALNMVDEENYITFGTKHHIINRANLIYKPIEGLEMTLESNMHYLQGVHLKRSAIILRDTIKDYVLPLFNMIEI